MNDKESSQSAELNSDHGDIDPSFGAGLRGFVVPHQSPLAHQPAEGSLHNPATRQDCKAHGGVGSFDDCFVLSTGEVRGEVHKPSPKTVESFNKMMGENFFVRFGNLLDILPPAKDVANTKTNGMAIQRLKDGEKYFYFLDVPTSCPETSIEAQIWHLVISIFE